MTRKPPESWMWLEACELLEQAERLHRQFFQLGNAAAQGPAWEPPVDICETEQQLHIEIALPGVAAERLEVSIDNGAIHVIGDRPLPAESRRGVIRRLEIPYGRFERWIELPPGRYELGQRELVNGCIRLVLHKA